ncbi:hypothetical protein VNI00_016038 [Paramarasmius palmivorus]|uniref:DUF6589 domain-containing protein n=1 Tax=Paramarasmius palmivorus TaxID=297713 RepID=A0AAW0BGG3_9AGAR
MDGIGTRDSETTPNPQHNQSDGQFPSHNIQHRERHPDFFSTTPTRPNGMLESSGLYTISPYSHVQVPSYPIPQSPIPTHSGPQVGLPAGSRPTFQYPLGYAPHQTGHALAPGLQTVLYYFAYPPALNTASPQLLSLIPEIDFSKLSAEEVQEVNEFLAKTAALEAEFLQGLFWGVVPIPKCIGSRKKRTRFQWPSEFDDDDQLLAFLHCMQQCGYETIAHLKGTLVTKQHSKHLSVNQALANFITNVFQDHVQPTTQQRLSNWALQRTLQCINEEANRLTSVGYFIRAPKAQVNWNLLTQFDLGKAQQYMIETAPALFSVLTTVALSDEAKRCCIQNPGPTIATASSPDENHEDINAFINSSGQSTTTNVPSESTVPHPLGTRWNPWLGVTVVMLILIHFRYQWAIIFPTLIGMFLFTCNANRDVFALLGRIGLSISYSATQTVLETLANDSSNRLKAFSAILEHGEPTFQLLFDNVNKMKQVWQLKLGKSEEVKSGTATTLVRLEDVPPGVLNFRMLQSHMRKPENNRNTITVQTLQSDIAWDHIENVGVATILRVWIKHVPSLQKFHSPVESLFRDKYTQRRLCLCKSEVHTMRTSDIDEAQVTGVKDVLLHLIKQLAILPIWLISRIVFIAGDQLTIDRICKIKLYSAKVNGLENFAWAQPVIQLWHLKWNWQKAIFKLLWLQDSAMGLGNDTKKVLGRSKFNPEKCDFYPAHHILEDRFDALVLHALSLLCKEKTKTTIRTQTPLIEALNGYFSKGGSSLEKVTFEELEGLAKIVYRRYMCSAAYDDTCYAYRPGDIYGTGNTSSTATATSATEDSAPAASLSTSRKGKKASEQRHIMSGDSCLANNIMFLRVTFWYLELCAGIAEGDIGRVLEIIKEHFNFWIKRLFNSKSMDFDSKYLSEMVSLNIGGFQSVRDAIPKMFGIKRSGSEHKAIKKLEDINCLGRHFRTHNILTFQPLRTSQPPLVEEEFSAGNNYLLKGGLRTVLERTMSGGEVLDISNGNESDVEVENADTPSNPITMTDGRIETSEFICNNSD